MHLLCSDHWLADPRNISLVRLMEPAFGLPLAPRPDNRTLMLHWAVADVVTFFETKDAEALGKSLAVNSMQGSDLLRFTVDSLRKDLNLNTFAAQKICHPRDAFLC